MQFMDWSGLRFGVFIYRNLDHFSLSIMSFVNAWKIKKIKKVNKLGFKQSYLFYCFCIQVKVNLVQYYAFECLMPIILPLLQTVTFNRLKPEVFGHSFQICGGIVFLKHFLTKVIFESSKYNGTCKKVAQVSVLNHTTIGKTGPFAVLNCSAYFGKFKSFQRAFKQSRFVEMMDFSHQDTLLWLIFYQIDWAYYQPRVSRDI